MTVFEKLNKTLNLNVPNSVLDAAVESAVKAMNDFADHYNKN